MDKNRNIDNKRQWTKPQLIVLVRSTPAESVLLSCKFAGSGEFSGPSSTFNGCYQGGECSPCGELIKS